MVSPRYYFNPHSSFSIPLSLSLSLSLSLPPFHFVYRTPLPFIPSSPKTSSFRPKLFFPSFYYFLHHIKPANFPPSPLITIHYESSSMTNLFLLSPSFSSNFTTPLAATLRSNRKKVRKKKKKQRFLVVTGGLSTSTKPSVTERERGRERRGRAIFRGASLSSFAQPFVSIEV